MLPSNNILVFVEVVCVEYYLYGPFARCLSGRWIIIYMLRLVTFVHACMVWHIPFHSIQIFVVLGLGFVLDEMLGCLAPTFRFCLTCT